MPSIIITVISVLGALFFVSAIYALWWAQRSGQFKRLEEGAKVIFDKDEPEGVQIDFFPPSRRVSKSKRKLAKNV